MGGTLAGTAHGQPGPESALPVPRAYSASPGPAAGSEWAPAVRAAEAAGCQLGLHPAGSHLADAMEAIGVAVGAAVRCLGPRTHVIELGHGLGPVCLEGGWPAEVSIVGPLMTWKPSSPAPWRS
jgi:hypothetical protein